MTLVDRSEISPLVVTYIPVALKLMGDTINSTSGATFRNLPVPLKLIRETPTCPLGMDSG